MSDDQNGFFTKSHPVITNRGIHLDLKGVPPTPERLLSLLDVFAAARFNMVLVEWEDMFPWTCDKRFQSELAYTSEQVQAFVAKADRLGIEVVPLVQCLGHMETPLKYPEYAHLREVPDQVGVINPLAPGAGALVLSMVDDVLTLLPSIKRFHLGGDEAFSFGTHPDTKAYIDEHGKGALYLHHVEPLLDHLLARGIRPILWHDMMCHWESPALERIREKADLCVWGYQRNPELVAPSRHFHISHIRRFLEHGINLWGATAYKGGDGTDMETPIVERRLENFLGWANTGSSLNMKGVFVTGWSRYSTLSVQLSPIDSSLDVLALAAVVLHDGEVPANGLAACADFLKQIGEYERFYRCHTAMEELARIKMAAWERIRITRENYACQRLDPTRANLATLRKGIKGVEDSLQQLTSQTIEIMAAFAGLVPDKSMLLYVGDRYDAIEQELRDLRQLLAME